MTSLQVQGSEGFADLADGEVRLEADELARLVLELVDRLPNEHRQQIAETLARAR